MSIASLVVSATLVILIVVFVGKEVCEEKDHIRLKSAKQFFLVRLERSKVEENCSDAEAKLLRQCQRQG